MARGHVLVVVVALAAGSFAFGLAGACASFGTESETVPQATDAQTEAAEAESGTLADVPFCQRFDAAPIFCTDFSASDPSTGWNTTTKIDGGTITRTEDTFTSAPSALEVSAPPAPGDGSNLAVLATGVDFKGAASIAIQFQFRPEDEGTPNSGSPVVLRIAFRSGGQADYDHMLSLGLDGVTLVQRIHPDGGAETDTGDFISAPLPLKQWTQIVIRTPLGAGDITVQVGATAKTVRSVRPASETDRSGTFTLGLEAGTRATSTLRYRFDDVAIIAE